MSKNEEIESNVKKNQKFKNTEVFILTPDIISKLGLSNLSSHTSEPSTSLSPSASASSQNIFLTNNDSGNQDVEMPEKEDLSTSKVASLKSSLQEKLSSILKLPNKRTNEELSPDSNRVTKKRKVNVIDDAKSETITSNIKNTSSSSSSQTFNADKSNTKSENSRVIIEQVIAIPKTKPSTSKNIQSNVKNTLKSLIHDRIGKVLQGQNSPNSSGTISVTVTTSVAENCDNKLLENKSNDAPSKSHENPSEIDDDEKSDFKLSDLLGSFLNNSTSNQEKPCSTEESSKEKITLHNLLSSPSQEKISDNKSCDGRNLDDHRSESLTEHLDDMDERCVSSVDLKVYKKRGRPKKNVIEESSISEIVQVIPEENTEQNEKADSSPTKRSRKPRKYDDFVLEDFDPPLYNVQKYESNLANTSTPKKRGRKPKLSILMESDTLFTESSTIEANANSINDDVSKTVDLNISEDQCKNFNSLDSVAESVNEIIKPESKTAPKKRGRKPKETKLNVNNILLHSEEEIIVKEPGTNVLKAVDNTDLLLSENVLEAEKLTLKDSSNNTNIYSIGPADEKNILPKKRGRKPKLSVTVSNDNSQIEPSAIEGTLYAINDDVNNIANLNISKNNFENINTLDSVHETKPELKIALKKRGRKPKAIKLNVIDVPLCSGEENNREELTSVELKVGDGAILQTKFSKSILEKDKMFLNDPSNVTNMENVASDTGNEKSIVPKKRGSKPKLLITAPNYNALSDLSFIETSFDTINDDVSNTVNLNINEIQTESMHETIKSELKIAPKKRGRKPKDIKLNAADTPLSSEKVKTEKELVVEKLKGVDTDNLQTKSSENCLEAENMFLKDASNISDMNNAILDSGEEKNILPKKRGRKPKLSVTASNDNSLTNSLALESTAYLKDDNLSNISNLNQRENQIETLNTLDSVTETAHYIIKSDFKTVPKKRGRKPKEIKNDPGILITSNIKNVALHLEIEKNAKEPITEELTADNVISCSTNSENILLAEKLTLKDTSMVTSTPNLDLDTGNEKNILPKKRGRKPKQINTSLDMQNISIAMEDSVNVDEKIHCGSKNIDKDVTPNTSYDDIKNVLVKKRGRKPKQGTKLDSKVENSSTASLEGNLHVDNAPGENTTKEITLTKKRERKPRQSISFIPNTTTVVEDTSKSLEVNKETLKELAKNKISTTKMETNEKNNFCYETAKNSDNSYITKIDDQQEQTTEQQNSKNVINLPKKRGRKPKQRLSDLNVTSEYENMRNSLLDSTNTEDKVPISEFRQPKKRGRKPKIPKTSDLDNSIEKLLSPSNLDHKNTLNIADKNKEEQNLSISDKSINHDSLIAKETALSEIRQPKKRGRKPKTATINLENSGNILTSEVNTLNVLKVIDENKDSQDSKKLETTPMDISTILEKTAPNSTQKIPKKRGRKPKFDANKLDDSNVSDFIDNSVLANSKNKLLTSYLDASNTTDTEDLPKQDDNTLGEETGLKINQPKRRGRKSKAVISQEYSFNTEEMLLADDSEVLNSSDLTELQQAEILKEEPDEKGIQDEVFMQNTSNISGDMVQQPSFKKKGRPLTKIYMEEDGTKTTSTSSKTVQCGRCQKVMPKINWSYHKISVHNNLAWKEGEEPIDIYNEKVAYNILYRLYRKKKAFHCEICYKSIKSVNGFLSHRSVCGKSHEEIQDLQLKCELCGKMVYKFSMYGHMEIHKKSKLAEIKQNESTSAEKITQDVSDLVTNSSDLNDAENPESNTSGPIRNISNRRKAAVKAVNLLQNLVDEEKNDRFEIINKYRCYLQKFDFFKMNICASNYIKSTLKKNGIVKCKYNECDSVCSTFQEFQQHMMNCVKRNLIAFTCKACLYTVDNENDAILHAKKKHGKNEKNSYIYDSSSDEEEESSENEREANENEEVELDLELEKLDRSFVSKKVMSRVENSSYDFMRVKPSKTYIRGAKLYKWTLNLYNDVSRTNLFPNCHRIKSKWLAINEMDAQQYFTLIKESPKIYRMSVNQIVDPLKQETFDWKTMKPFESELHEDEGVSTIFCGGPIRALAWAPTPQTSGKCDQILAVSCQRNPDKNYEGMRHYKHRNVVQFWNYGPLKNKFSSKNLQPKLDFCLAHNYGMVWSLEWCPSSCYDDKENQEICQRLGLLAMGCSDGNVYIHTISHKASLPENASNVYTSTPHFILILENIYSSKTVTECHATKISWTKAPEHKYISVGYSNGMIALYDLSLTNPLLIDKVFGSTVTLLPYLSFQAHVGTITGLTLSHLNNGNRWLMSCSIDRRCKYWDLEDVKAPISVSKQFLITEGVWATHWLCSFTSMDDSLVSNNIFSYWQNVRDFGDKHMTIMYADSTLTSTTFNDWTNGLVHGTMGGEVVGANLKNTFLAHTTAKSLKPYRFISSYTSLIELNETVENRLDKYRKKVSALKNLKVPSPPKEHIRLLDAKVLEENPHFFEDEPRTYEGAKIKYGLVFCDFQLNSNKYVSEEIQNHLHTNSKLEVVAPHMWPLRSVNKVCWNPNCESFLYLASGYEAGFVRVTYINAKYD